MQDKTKRICSRCKIDQTPLGRGLSMENDRRGDCLGLFCEECWIKVHEAVLASPRCYRHVDGWQSRQQVFDLIMGLANTY